MNEERPVATAIKAGQDWQITQFAPEDAPGVVSLFRSVYGEGYPVRTYMESDLLIAENAAQRTISSVAKTTDGAVVGHTAMFNSAPYPGTFEAGAGVVHAAYRGGKGIFTQLVIHCLKTAALLPMVEAVFDEPVCNHPFSQKMSVKVGFVTRALEVDLMPAAAYEKEASATGRVAAFLDFKTLRAKPHTLYLPAVYKDEFQLFYQDFDDEREFLVSAAAIPAGTVTDMRSQLFAFAAVARVAFHTIGEDFPACIDALEKTLRQEGVLVTQLWLKLDCPWVGAATEVLRQKGYFIGGALPRWFDTDGILMQKMAKRPDWEGICVVSERGNQILDRVRSDWQRTQK